MSKKDLYYEIAINVFGAVLVMMFLTIIAVALIIIENITASAAIMVEGVFAMLIGILVYNEIASAIRLYKLSKEEEL